MTTELGGDVLIADEEKPRGEARIRTYPVFFQNDFIVEMSTLTIKDVPVELHERLKERAERHRRSMNSEAIRILEQVLSPSRLSAEEAISRSKALNKRIDADFDQEIIESKKREGLT